MPTPPRSDRCGWPPEYLPTLSDGGRSDWLALAPAAVMLFLLPRDAFAQREYFAAAWALPMTAVFIRHADDQSWPPLADRLPRRASRRPDNRRQAAALRPAWRVGRPLLVGADAKPFIPSPERSRRRGRDWACHHRRLARRVSRLSAEHVRHHARGLRPHPRNPFYRSCTIEPVSGPWPAWGLRSSSPCGAARPQRRSWPLWRRVFSSPISFKASTSPIRSIAAALFSAPAACVVVFRRLRNLTRASLPLRVIAAGVYGLAACVVATLFFRWVCRRRPVMHDLTWARCAFTSTCARSIARRRNVLSFGPSIGAVWVGTGNSQLIAGYTRFALRSNDLTPEERKRYLEYHKTDLEYILREIKDKRPDIIIEDVRPDIRLASARN